MPAEYDVVLPPAPASGPTPDTIQACHMKAAARNGDYKLIQLINDTELLCKRSLSLAFFPAADLKKLPCRQCVRGSDRVTRSGRRAGNP